MIIPHIVAAPATHYVGKATNQLDEATLLELAEPGEFVNVYASADGKHVPAHRAKELLSRWLAKPAKKNWRKTRRRNSHFLLAQTSIYMRAITIWK
jgi:hypothetical protein